MAARPARAPRAAAKKTYMEIPDSDEEGSDVKQEDSEFELSE